MARVHTFRTGNGRTSKRGRIALASARLLHSFWKSSDWKEDHRRERVHPGHARPVHDCTSDHKYHKQVVILETGFNTKFSQKKLVLAEELEAGMTMAYLM